VGGKGASKSALLLTKKVANVFLAAWFSGGARV
jgi:hypothetical protein